MISKVIKYMLSLLRIVSLKLIYRKSLVFKFKNFKSLYIGKGVQIKIKKGNKIFLGQNVYIDDYCRLECNGGDIYIGNNTFINTRVNIISLKNITIGNYCLLGPNVGLYDHDHNYKNKDLPISKQGFNVKEIIIHDNIWIGAQSIVTKGVNIKDKCIIGANAVVTKDINSSGIYGGIPCKFIKNLYD